jgi:hypothetical protein
VIALQLAATCIGLLIALILIAIAFHERGYRRGSKASYQNGYEFGRRDADNWWIAVEAQVDEARRQIWKEEMQR